MNNLIFWGSIAGIIIIVVTIGLAMYGAISGNMFSELPVKEWTISEAIFYGSVLIALAVFFGGK